MTLPGIFRMMACCLMLAGGVQAEGSGNLLNDGQPIGTGGDVPPGWKPSPGGAEWVVHPSKPDAHVFQLTASDVNVYWRLFPVFLPGTQELEFSFKWKPRMVEGSAIASIRWFGGDKKILSFKNFESADTTNEFVEIKEVVLVPEGAALAEVIFKFDPHAEGTVWVEAPVLVPVKP